MYKFIARDRTQDDYSIEPDRDISHLDISMLMHNDTFVIENSKIIIMTSLKEKPICGILKMNKKFGKQNKKIMYKCIPNNNLLPIVLIPIKDENSFCKHMVDRYVIFNYITNDLGQLCQTIGPVNNIECFYEYQLSCKDLNISNKNFTKMVNNINYSHDNYSIDNAITIDSLDTQDYDDAISFNNNCISVHISNVPIYIEKHNLWNYINKVSTIYLPDKKRSMLPTKLTDNILSLKAGEKRDVFSMNIQFDENNNISINFSKDIIKIRKNHIYESEKLLNDNIYKNINDKVHILLPKYPYVHHVSNSHELIEYLMIFMNAQCAIKLHESSVGIYRSLILESNRESEIDDPIIRKFISYWKNSKSEYTIKPDHEHQLLMLKDYVHITSPIRRLVDIVNMMMLQHVLNIYIFGNNALTFYNYHTNNLIAINKSVKDIKRIQNDCTILQYYWEKSSLNEYNELMDVTLDNNRAYVIDILDNNEYQVLLNDTKYIGKLFSDIKLYLYDIILVKILIFTDKSSIKQKIKIISY